MSTDGDTVGVALVQAAWDASLLEVRQKGSAEGPFTLHQIELRFGKLGSPQGPWPVPRHAVKQGDKFRPIDDGTRGGHNAAYRCFEKVSMVHATFPAAVGRRFFDCYEEKGEKCPRVGSSVNDTPNAFGSCPGAEREFQIAVCVNPRSGRIGYWVIHGHAFGFKASIPNWCEISAAICILACLFFAAVTMPYVDDYTTVETEMSLGEKVHGPTGYLQYPDSAETSVWRMAHCCGSS